MKKYKANFRYIIALYVLISLECNATKKSNPDNFGNESLSGTWVVVEQSTSQLAILPRCKLIKQGSVFKFSQNTLEVYPSASGKPCDVYPFKLSGNTISFYKEDMVWLSTYELRSNYLKLTSSNFFTPENPVEKLPPPASEVVVILARE